MDSKGDTLDILRTCSGTISTKRSGGFYRCGASVSGERGFGLLGGLIREILKIVNF